MPSLSGKRILVVEDDYFLAFDVCEAIEAARGFVLGPFPDTTEATRTLKTHVDLAVLDVSVRDGTTYSLAENLLRLGIPFVFASGQAINTKPEKWKTSSWILKPYHPKEIISWLERAFKEQ